MQDFYPDLSQESYEEKALDKATSLFFELVGEAKEACLARIAEVYGQESYDLLKNYSEGLKLLGKGFHKKYKKQILSCIIPCLPKAKALELIQLDMKQVFFGTTYHSDSIEDAQTFYIFLYNHLKKNFTDIESRTKLYTPYQKEAMEMFRVEKYLFVKKIELLYIDYCHDMALIWENIEDKKNSLEYVDYFLPYFNVTLNVACPRTIVSEDGEVSIIFKINFSPQDIISAEKKPYHISWLQDIEVKTLHEFFSANVLPTLQGAFKEELQHYLAQQELAMAYHLKSAEATELLATKDMQNVLLTYDTHHNKGQSMALSLELDLRAGKLQASINSKLYSKKMWALIGGLTLSVISFLIGVFMKDTNGFPNGFLLILIGMIVSAIMIRELSGLFSTK